MISYGIECMLFLSPFLLMIVFKESALLNERNHDPVVFCTPTASSPSISSLSLSLSHCALGFLQSFNQKQTSKKKKKMSLFLLYKP
ncbi:hypothetical protein RIF29_24479 [Crotalaria pallida]|uniref:Uncharacterized protein n=1 Tax=Crotalaria pallida TaxID=3830 RepID=A0AAN9EM28_CROPI